jgi:WhiB family redox-sensing transcriptional regulator
MSQNYPSLGTGFPWARYAACRDAPGVDFFAERAALEEVERAKAVCRLCPVRLSCLEAGLEEQFGVWGGLSSAERRRLRREHQRAA